MPFAFHSHKIADQTEKTTRALILKFPGYLTAFTTGRAVYNITSNMPQLLEMHGPFSIDLPYNLESFREC
jgi:hypothetical protein